MRIEVRIERRIGTGTLAALDCFIVAGVLGVYLKLALLGPPWGAIARFPGALSPDAVPLSTRVGLCVHDIWLNLLVIPVLSTAVVVMAFRRYREDRTRNQRRGDGPAASERRRASPRSATPPSSARWPV